MTIKTKRVYDKPEPEDGLRILIMRHPIWINKAFREFQQNPKRWMPELSPSSGLLMSYKNNTVNWDTFELSFIKEVCYNPYAIAGICKLYEQNKTSDITLLCQERGIGTVIDI